MAYNLPANAENLPVNPWQQKPSTAANTVSVNCAQQQKPTAEPTKSPQQTPTTTEDGLYANPWSAPKNDTRRATSNNIQQAYARKANVAIPNAPRNIPHIQRGGMANIQRPQEVRHQAEQEDSLWDSLFGGDSSASPSSAQNSSSDGWGSLFGDSSDSQPSSSSTTDDLSRQYDEYVKQIDDQYQSVKRSTMKSIDGVINSVDDLTKTTKKLLK